MNSQYVNRIIRACKLDVNLYEEVEAIAEDVMNALRKSANATNIDVIAFFTLISPC